MLVGADGERRFITSRSSSLRRMRLGDILPALQAPDIDGTQIACLASLFVSPLLSLADTAALEAWVHALDHSCDFWLDQEGGGDINSWKRYGWLNCQNGQVLASVAETA